MHLRVPTKSQQPSRNTGDDGRTSAEVSRRSVLAGSAGLLIVRQPPTTRSRKAGTPLQGWGVVSSNHWPTIGNAVVVRPTKRSTTVYRQPDKTSPGVTLTDRQTVVGKVNLLATDANDEWVQVLVPARPNGIVGWVPLEFVSLYQNPHRIQIELSAGTLTWTAGTEVLLTERVSTGTGETPTPTGLFATKEIVPQTKKNTVVGPVALGLTGFSEVLYNFAGGQGTVAIHGTNAPGQLGNRVSKGCIRLSNPSILRVAAEVPIGTPVEIVTALSKLPKQRWVHPFGKSLPIAAGEGPPSTKTS
jgi:lipoprotein-anchoring transpeptidase ErfK/SrfK